MVMCQWSMDSQCICEDNGKAVASTWRLIRPLGSGGGWRAMWLLDFQLLVATEVGRGKCRLEGQAWQPISHLTTRLVTGPEANPGPPAHQLEGCQTAATAMESYPDLTVWTFLGSFCSRNSPLCWDSFPEKSQKEPRLNGHRERRPVTLVRWFLGKNCHKECPSLQRSISVVYLRRKVSWPWWIRGPLLVFIRNASAQKESCRGHRAAETWLQ